jgi:hypothetical protein
MFLESAAVRPQFSARSEPLVGSDARLSWGSSRKTGLVVPIHPRQCQAVMQLGLGPRTVPSGVMPAGLVEQRDRPYQAGIEQAASQFAATHLAPKQVIESLLDVLIGNNAADDDIAVLVVEHTAQPPT